MTEQLLDALLLAYFRREVTQKRAAKLLGMRTSEFAELATGWAVELFERAIKANADEVEEVRRGVEWRLYLRRFLATFPECDPRACRHDTLPAAIGDDLFRPVPDAPVTTYAGTAAATLPPAEPYIGNRYPEPWDNREVGSPVPVYMDEEEPELQFDEGA